MTKPPASCSTSRSAPTKPTKPPASPRSTRSAALPAAAAQKHFVLVAKTAQRESICRAALGRLGGDQKALGTVCRRAEIEAVRVAALEGLTDPAELVATALRSNFRDVALGALERIASDQAALKSVATRAANPAAARKARALLRGARGRAEGGRRA